jgi:MFS family permease
LSATAAGAVLIPSSVIFLVLSPVSGALVPRIGPRRLMTAGILAVAVGFVWLAYGRPAGIYVEAILPVCFCGARARADGDAADCRGAGGVSDADIGEASGISDVASRLGRAVLTALVPVLSWVQAGRSLT